MSLQWYWGNPLSQIELVLHDVKEIWYGSVNRMSAEGARHTASDHSEHCPDILDKFQVGLQHKMPIVK